MDFGLKSYQTGCRNCVENTVQLSVFFFATFWILVLQKTREQALHSGNRGRACIVLRKERKERRRGAAGPLLFHGYILPEESKERLKNV
jgi:hypothetical protein